MWQSCAETVLRRFMRSLVHVSGFWRIGMKVYGFRV